MSRLSSSEKKSSQKQAKAASECPCEEAMCALMGAAKMIHRFVESKLNKHKQFNKLSGPRIGVLFVVHEAGAIRMGDLAAKMQVAPRTTTDIVDGLERDGFLQRRPDPKDRRAMLLELSPSARSDFEKISSLRKAFVQEVFGHLSNEDLHQLVELLNRVKQGPLSKMLESQLKDEANSQV